MEKVLETVNLSAGYVSGKKTDVILRDVTLMLHEGMLVSILGANGIGKSTLLRTISGVQRPVAGEVLLCGKPIGAYNRRRLSQLVSIVSTDRTYAGGFTVEELVGLGRQPHTGFFGRLDDLDRQIVAQAMESVGIAHKAKAFVAELSDGERQKTMIAKALAQEARIIILDEPTSFLDVASRIEILRLLHRLAHEEGKSILLSSHDIAQSLAFSDRLWLLASDRTLTDGVTEDLVLDGRMNDLFVSDCVVFDSVAGEYLLVGNETKKVAVEAANLELTRWTTNALRRNGYAVVDAAPLRVVARGAHDFLLPETGETASSIAGLLTLLQSERL